MTDNDKAGVFCCKALEGLTSQFEKPIYRPIVINRETMDLESAGWAIDVYNPTSTGAPKKREQVTVSMIYCPFCGTRLREEKT